MDTVATPAITAGNSGLNEVLAAVEATAHGPIRMNSELVDQNAVWPEAGMRALQAAGLAGLVVPRRSGGLGHGLFALTRSCEILGAECTSTAICFGMHCVGSAVIAAQVTETQAETYLRPIAEGRHLTTLALSEPGTGAHFYYPQTRLEQKPDGTLIIDGTKHFVTNGSHADSYVISVTHDDDDGLAQFSCVVLRSGLDGMTWGAPWQGFGMRGNDSRLLALEGVETPASDLLGSEGDQSWYVFNVVAPYFLMAMAGTYLGVAGAALELARRHLMEREFTHDGRRLAEATVLQHRYGRLWGRLEAARRLIYSAGTRFDAGEEDAVTAVLISKAEVADAATEVVNECMTLMGGVAYRDGARIQRLLRDVRAAHVMAPTTDLLWTWAGRQMLGRPLFGD